MREILRRSSSFNDMRAVVRRRLLDALAMVRWWMILAAMAATVGSLCAAFLWSLDAATKTRFDHPWLLFLLPVGGFAVGWLYHRFGASVEGGNNLIVDEIHAPNAGVPARMAPLIVLGTLVTHLFGGSAGREGTAVQLGGSLAATFGRLLGLDPPGIRILLMAGIAAGFGAVFGTPIAGAVFALEVLALGRIEYGALAPCLLAAVVGDWVCQAWGIHHGDYRIDYLAGPAKALVVEPVLLAKVVLAGVAFGLAALVFAEANHRLSGLFKRFVPYGPLRPFVGGLAVIGLVYAVGTRDYLGLGVSAAGPDGLTIASFFSPDVHPWSWALKIFFTVVTLSAGFKGGEVTPLFFIGAALGNAVAGGLGAPLDLFAALGFVAVFAGAANTPLACTLMGIELFGATHGVYIATACVMAYLASGHHGIYLSQRIAVAKSAGAAFADGTTLREVRRSPVPAVRSSPPEGERPAP